MVGGQPAARRGGGEAGADGASPRIARSRIDKVTDGFLIQIGALGSRARVEGTDGAGASSTDAITPMRTRIFRTKAYPIA